ncbi:zinc finger domain-containing protein [Streptomyces anandii]|uniref:zinc finger domain-containing protein n=1 Tax=Streptomyces anandii TaxID=285454 RepID=UPI0037BC56B4
MTASEPVQAPRTAWMNRMRAEALRMRRPDVSKVVHIGWIIASYADSDGTNAFPKTPTIAAIAGSSEETVTRAKSVLKALGVLGEKRRPNQPSEYSLLQPLGDRLDWDAHMHLYTDTRQARRKKAIKEKEIAEFLADGRNPVQNGDRNPVRNGDHKSRNPFPTGVPEPVPAGGTEIPGTRSGTGPEPDAERVPEPVPAGGVQRDPYLRRDKRPDKELADLEPQPQDARANRPTNEPDTIDHGTGPVLLPVPSPRGRQRTTPSAAAGASQPPLLFPVPDTDLTTLRATATPEDVRQVLAEHGHAVAMRVYGRDLVMRELATGTTTSAGHRPPATTSAAALELGVPCSYCQAPPGAACRTHRNGARPESHDCRTTDWATSRAHCPHCQAVQGAPCVTGLGNAHGSAHQARINLARALDATPTTETGT